MARKAKIIVSDLHVGAGFAPDNPLEDFTDDEFADFLGGIVTESDTKTMDVELIMNGDIVEFLQVPATDIFDPGTAYPPETYRPTSEEASADKMALIIAGHPTFFTALRDFVNALGKSPVGFATNGAIFFPFDGPIDPTTLPDPAASLAAESSVFLVDVDPASPQFDERIPVDLQFKEAAETHSPANLLVMLPRPGASLRPSTQYAAVILDGLPKG